MRVLPKISHKIKLLNLDLKCMEILISQKKFNQSNKFIEEIHKEGIILIKSSNARLKLIKVKCKLHLVNTSFNIQSILFLAPQTQILVYLIIREKRYVPIQDIVMELNS